MRLLKIKVLWPLPSYLKKLGEKKNLRGSSIQELRDYQVITTKQSAKRKEIGPQSQIDGQDVNNNRFNL